MEHTKGEMTTDGQDSIRVGGTEVAHMCSNFDWTVRRANAKELVRRWNSQPDLLEACKYLIGDKTSDDIAHRLCLTGTEIQKIIAIIAAIAKVS